MYLLLATTVLEEVVCCERWAVVCILPVGTFGILALSLFVGFSFFLLGVPSFQLYHTILYEFYELLYLFRSTSRGRADCLSYEQRVMHLLRSFGIYKKHI